MGVSIKWLKEYVDFDWGAQELEHRLTMAGIAIEGVKDFDGDSLLELDLTPNRGDCLGVINLAREVGALTGNPVRIPEMDMTDSLEKIEDYIKVEIADLDLCPRYTARLVKNVKIAESPLWLQNRLLGRGIRPINNVVDITNYVMLETNQPLHAFDYDLLSPAKKIIVRRALADEEIITLDDVKRELNSDMLLITDNNRPVALAGIMGGQNTEIGAKTVNVLLESACFKRTNIRRTSSKLALRSDSSVRFEKGSDINGVIYAINRATQLMAELADGTVIAGICDCYPNLVEPKEIALRPERVNYLLGTELTAEEIISCIERLKFEWRQAGENYLVSVPTYRPDIEMEVDLIEEVARLHGYENIEATLPVGDTTQGGRTEFQQYLDKLNQYLNNIFYEVINYSFITPRWFDMIRLPQDSLLREVVEIANPLSEEQSVMRTLLLPGLLDAVSRNLARKINNLAFYEVGSVFFPQPEGLPTETLKLGIIVAGKDEPNWLKQNMEMDFFYLKGVLENLLVVLGISDVSWEETQDPSYHPGRSAVIYGGGKKIGVLGEIHPLVRANFEIKPRACACELDVNTLYDLSKPRLMKESINRYPAVERDLAIIVDRQIRAVDALHAIKESGGSLLYNATIFDVYAGEQVPNGKKSLAFKMVFQSPERTLTETEVNLCMEAIKANLHASTGAVLR